MWWTSGSSGFINVLQLSKYLSESNKTLYIESLRWCAIGNGKILPVNQILSVPGLFFNYSTMKGLGPKILAWGPKFLDCLWENLFCLVVAKFQLILSSDCWVMPHFVIYIEGAWDRHHFFDNQFLSNIFCIMSHSSRLWSFKWFRQVFAET